MEFHLSKLIDCNIIDMSRAIKLNYPQMGEGFLQQISRNEEKQWFEIYLFIYFKKKLGKWAQMAHMRKFQCHHPGSSFPSLFGTNREKGARPALG